MTVWLGNYPIPTDPAPYSRQRDAIVEALKKYGTDHVSGVTVGNEYMLKYVVCLACHNVRAHDLPVLTHQLPERQRRVGPEQRRRQRRRAATHLEHHGHTDCDPGSQPEQDAADRDGGRRRVLQ